MGPEGRLAKLDALCEALRFMKVVVIAAESTLRPLKPKQQ